MTTKKKLKPPQKVGCCKLGVWCSPTTQDRPYMVINAFSACGISGTVDVCSITLLEGQQHPDSDEAGNNPFMDEPEGFDYDL